MLEEYFDAEYEYSGAKIWNRKDSCHASTTLREYLQRKPALDAQEQWSSGNTRYMAVPWYEVVLPGRGIPTESRDRIVESKQYQFIEFVSDQLDCGEHYFLLQYMRWYMGIYNEELYLLEEAGGADDAQKDKAHLN